ncbi:MAG: CehA/McbA family metallohydrolase [Bryobacterales bacterium]|nr:CehA/McbA family metallohydrolase [Bryobacteraceae bacterium]MDW8353898.1 CehA/McbA family metallohydrolase [Bryobacterales bacterium]
MRRVLAIRVVLGSAALWGLLTVGSGRATQAPPLRWYKGNLHTHTLNSDGDSTPSEVAAWYRANRYHFLVLSDHNYLTEVEGLNAVHGAKEKFLLIPGEEVTDRFEDKPVHVNAYNPIRLVEPAGGATLVDTIQRNVDAIRAAKGLPSLNHPNFGWAISSRDLLQIRDLSLFEIYNGHPKVNNLGGGGFESLEEMWDALLTAGRRLYGIAVDDAHHFKSWGREYSNPGRGWVMVRAAALTVEEILRGLESGNFYASTGVELNAVEADERELRLEIRTDPALRYTTYFIGAGGQVLAKSYDTKPAYQFRGGERYVRARVVASSGDTAWTQPVFLPD